MREREEGTGGSDHEAVLALLPWHANGTLEAEERALVARHLTGCAECRAELALCRDGLDAVHLTDDAGWEPPPGQLERLLDRLPPPAEAPGLGVRVRSAWRGQPARIRWVLAAQSALAAGLAGVVLWQATAPAPSTYRTLSRAEASAAPGPRLEIVFAEDATEAQLRALLRAAGGSIVAGPTARGVYTVALAEGASLEAVVASLRADPRVRLAEPLGPPPP